MFSIGNKRIALLACMLSVLTCLSGCTFLTMYGIKTPNNTIDISVNDNNNNEVPEAASISDDSQKEELALEYAEAVAMRDGRAQYELFSDKLKKSVIAEFEGLDWVTGTSSPWVTGYTVEVSGNNATIILTLSDSTMSKYSQAINITFAKENEKPVINSTKYDEIKK